MDNTNWQIITIIGANLAVFIGFMGSVIALIIYSNKRMDVQLKAIADEMRDFHSQMAGLSRDFHGRLISIEERNKGDK